MFTQGTGGPRPASHLDVMRSSVLSPTPDDVDIIGENQHCLFGIQKSSFSDVKAVPVSDYQQLKNDAARMNQAIYFACDGTGVQAETADIFLRFKNSNRPVTVVFCDFNTSSETADMRPWGKIVPGDGRAIVYLRYDQIIVNNPTFYYFERDTDSIVMTAKTLTHELTHLRDYLIGFPNHSKAQNGNMFDRLWSEVNAHYRHARFLVEVGHSDGSCADPFVAALTSDPPPPDPEFQTLQLLIEKKGYNFSHMKRFLKGVDSFESFLEKAPLARRFADDNNLSFFGPNTF